MALKQVHCVVRGRVQGVFFRASTEREALRIGLSGWVKNREDGRVELLAEGEEADLQALVAWVHLGPPAAEVKGVEVGWGTFTGDYASFSVVG
jgi:acylphosphatase